MIRCSQIENKRFQKEKKQFYLRRKLKMRKVFNKVMAGAMTTALVATLAVGFKVNTTDVKADTANALTGSWTSSAESYEPNDAVITQTTFKSTAVDNVSANISITGWQANWTAESAAPEDAIVLNDKIWGRCV